MKFFSLRKTYAICALCAFLSLIIDAYLQKTLFLATCNLIYAERIIFFTVMITFLGSAIFQHTYQSKYLFGGINFFISVFGAVTAGRHAWLQHHPSTFAAHISPDAFTSKIAYWIQLIKYTYIGTPICSRIQWTILRLSIAEWRFVIFTAFAIVCIWQMMRNNYDLVSA